MSTSPQLKTFLAALDDRPDPRSLAWDIGPVQTLPPAERQVAEDALIARATQGDLRAIKSLGLLGATRAISALQHLAQNGAAPERTAAERALGLLTGDPKTIAKLVASMGGQIDAFTAWDLKSMPGDEAFKGLLTALHSADLPARMHALDGLAQRTQVESLREPMQSPLGRYELLLGSRLESLYLPAANALADLFTQLAAGTSPDALGLVYHPSPDADLADRYFESSGATGKPYDDALLAHMTDHDRDWALALVVARIEDRDPRSLDTIEQQHLRWAGPVLEEAILTAAPPLRARMIQVLETVRAPHPPA